MANEFKHKDPGSALTQAEFIASDGTGHIFESQAAGDVLYASSSTVLARLAKATDGNVLELASGLPAWTASPTIGSTSWANANHAHAASNSGGTVSANDVSGTTLKSTVVTSSLESLGTLTALTVDDVAVNGKVITMTGSSGDTAVFTVGTNGTLSLVTVDTAAAAANIQITADGTVDIDSAGVLTLNSGAAINIEPESGSAVLIDGAVSIDGGAVTGIATLSASGVITAGGFTIGSAAILEAELEILDGASVTTAELNIIDGGTSATGTTIADADRVVLNDNGTMVQVAVTDLKTYIGGGLSVHAGSFTRDSAAASESGVAVTGVPFTPKAIIFFMNVSGHDEMSFGLADDSNSGMVADQNGQQADDYYSTTGRIIQAIQASNVEYSGVLASMESDGFTIDWTKTGGKTGTMLVNYLAIS